ncbi:hypothetical protein RN50_00440 [Microbacterium foliorum]|uniref:Uncharacterized protein n=1 Tax=Microbacterium foliorum TaxID=104336 RepID=A0A0F0KZZ7_9MICO|nr:hypothetical protein RN50_00440 [Microbacterium foliorum]
MFVSLDDDGLPTPHGYSEITYNRDRMPTERLATGTGRLPDRLRDRAVCRID